jgi:hypothetical protein
MSYFILLFAACALLFGCGAAKSSGAYENVPYCSGGNRAHGCMGGKICQMASGGCQVCVCEGLDD